mgnify:CR=1 FL=1
MTPPTLPACAPLSPLFGSTLDELRQRQQRWTRHLRTFVVIVAVGTSVGWAGLWVVLFVSNPRW